MASQGMALIDKNTGGDSPQLALIQAHDHEILFRTLEYSAALLARPSLLMPKPQHEQSSGCKGYSGTLLREDHHIHVAGGRREAGRGGGEGGWSACSRQTHLQHQEMGDCELEELTMGGEVRLLEGRCSGGCKEVRGIKRGRSRQAARS